MATRKMLPCSGCGRELASGDAEETTALVDVTDEPVFAGRKGQREAPALICPSVTK